VNSTSPSGGRDIERQPPGSAPWIEKERAADKPTRGDGAPNIPGTTKEPERNRTPQTPTAGAPTREDPGKSRAPEEQKEFGESVETVRIEDGNNSGDRAKRVRPENEINSGNNSPSELIEPDKPAPQVVIPEIKKVGKVGRQRRYDELGIDDIEPIKEVILFRHQMGRHWPGLSKDMEAYYERMYFTKPKRGSRDATHNKCWERRERWLHPTTAQPTGDSSKVTPYRKRASG